MAKKLSPSADDQAVWDVVDELNELKQTFESVRQKHWRNLNDISRLRQLEQAARELEARLASLKPVDTKYAENVRDRIENFQRELAKEQQRIAQEFSQAIQQLPATTGQPSSPEQVGVTVPQQRMRDFLLEFALVAVQTIKAIGGKLSWIFFRKSGQ